MTGLWPIAVITFKEGIRNRAIYGICLFALMLLVLTMLIANMAPRDVGKVAVDMTLSAISFSGLLVVLFVGINLLAKDFDRRTIYMVLAKPISRQEYLLGKFFGIVLILLTTGIILSLFSSGVLVLLHSQYTGYFERFSWQMVALAILFIELMLIMLSALSFLFASFSSTSFITLVLTIISYIIGQSLSDVKALIDMPRVSGEPVPVVTAAVVHAAYYVFPNLSLFDIKILAAHGITISLSRCIWTMLYGLAYTALVLTVASLVFRKKEFP